MYSELDDHQYFEYVNSADPDNLDANPPPFPLTLPLSLSSIPPLPGYIIPTISPIFDLMNDSMMMKKISNPCALVPPKTTLTPFYPPL